MPALACNLLDVADPENAPGRGARVFDPYQSAASGAIRLSLQMYNGCASLPTGQTVPKNTASIPYPETCSDPTAIDGFPPYVQPGELRLVTNTDYFFSQFTVVDTVINAHTNPANLSEPLHWITKQSRFKNLDWGGVGQYMDEWSFLPEITGVLQDKWTREVLFGNANWRAIKDDYFTIEVLDAAGSVKATSPRYLRSEFLTETPYAGHSNFTWRMEGVNPPRFPGDNAVNPLPEIPGWPPQAPVFRTVARLDLFGSTNPFKTFRIPDSVRGEGALRVVWSQLPEEPFYFPVTFLSQEDVPATCFDAQGNANTKCGFGVDPNVNLVAPANGQYYVGGEVVNMFIDARDGDGNRLHAPNLLPSGLEMVSNQANGTLYAQIPYLEKTLEKDMISAINLAGPLHKMRTRSNPKEKPDYFAPEYVVTVANETATTPLNHSEFGSQWSTRQSFQLPVNAEAGTYVALIKWNRYFAGERVAKLKPFFFQVGSMEKTFYPGRVGNCQMCHRGVLSLDNLRHGLPVDHIEACKTCHAYETSLGFTFMENIHKIHMRSPKFPVAKNDCTACHFTRESTTRPSLYACETCHVAAHGAEYFAQRFVNGTEPSRYGNCAQQCHGEKPPQLHIIPEN